MAVADTGQVKALPWLRFLIRSLKNMDTAPLGSGGRATTPGILTEQGWHPLPEIMIPLVVNVREVRMISEIIDREIQTVMKEKSLSIRYKIGTMMETPRACLGAGRLANDVEFMSFGTNDLTQMTYGFSRDDAGKFIPEYLDKKLFETDPFVSLYR